MTTDEKKDYLVNYIRLCCEDKKRLKIDPAMCFEMEIKTSDHNEKVSLLNELVIEDKIKRHPTANKGFCYDLI